MKYSRIKNYTEDSNIMLPYIDWENIRNCPSPHERFAICTGREAIDKTAVINEEPAFDKAKRFAAMRFVHAMKDSGLSYNEIEDRTGCDKALLCKMKSGARGFALAVANLEGASHSLMNISVNNLMFGEEMALNLPGVLNLIAGAMYDLDDHSILRIHNLASFAVSTEVSRRDDKPRSMQHILRSRLDLYLQDSGEVPCHVLGVDTPAQLRSSLPYIWSKETFDPKLPTYMYAALVLKCPLDFLTCEYYVDYVDVYATIDGERKLIENYKIKKTIEKLSRLEDMQTNPVLAEIYGIIFSKKVWNKSAS